MATDKDKKQKLCIKCKGTNFGKKKLYLRKLNQETSRIENIEAIGLCKDCVGKQNTQFELQREAKQIPFGKDLRPKLEKNATQMKKQDDIVLTNITLKESRNIDCIACGFPLSSNKCYISKQGYYCGRDGDLIETYYKQLHGLDDPNDMKVIFTMRRYSLKDNRLGRGKLEGTISANFGKKYCSECVFLNYFHNRSKGGNKIEEELKLCLVSIKLLESDFVADETIRSSVAYYCLDGHAQEGVEEMAKSRDDVIDFEYHTIQKMESRVLELTQDKKKPFGN